MEARPSSRGEEADTGLPRVTGHTGGKGEPDSSFSGPPQGPVAGMCRGRAVIETTAWPGADCPQGRHGEGVMQLHD